MAERVVRFRRERLSVGRQRLFDAPGFAQRHRAGAMKIEAVGAQPAGCIEHRPDLVEAAKLAEDDAAGRVRFVGLRRHAHRRVGGGQRLVETLQPPQRARPRHMRGAVVGIARQQPVGDRQRVGVAAGGIQDRALGEQGVAVLRIDGERRIDRHKRLGNLSETLVGGRGADMGRDIVRPQRRRTAEILLRVQRLALVEQAPCRD